MITELHSTISRLEADRNVSSSCFCDSTTDSSRYSTQAFVSAASLDSNFFCMPLDDACPHELPTTMKRNISASRSEYVVITIPPYDVDATQKQSSYFKRHHESLHYSVPAGKGTVRVSAFYIILIIALMLCLPAALISFVSRVEVSEMTEYTFSSLDRCDMRSACQLEKEKRHGERFVQRKQVRAPDETNEMSPRSEPSSTFYRDRFNRQTSAQDAKAANRFNEAVIARRFRRTSSHWLGEVQP